MNSDIPVKLPVLLLVCLLQSACSDSTDPASTENTPMTGDTPADVAVVPSDPSLVVPLDPPDPDEQLQDPIEDPAQQLVFFNAPYLQLRDAANAAISGFDLVPQLQNALAVVPDGTVGGADSISNVLDTASVDCISGGTVAVSEIVTIEPNTNITVRTHAFDQCVQNGSTFDGTVTSTTSRFVSGAASRTTTMHAFNLAIDGLTEGQGALAMGGESSTVELTEFNTPPDCPPANSLRQQITINEGGIYEDSVTGIGAQFQSLTYTRSSVDRFVETEQSCEATVFTTFDAEATGVFDSIADALVMISKTGVYSANGIAESDSPAALTVNASASDDALLITATGDSPTSVQIDIVDTNAVLSFRDNWDFAE